MRLRTAKKCPWERTQVLQYVITTCYMLIKPSAELYAVQIHMQYTPDPAADHTECVTSHGMLAGHAYSLNITALLPLLFRHSSASTYLPIGLMCMKLQYPPRLHVFSSYCLQVASLKSVTGENSALTGRPA